MNNNKKTTWTKTEFKQENPIKNIKGYLTHNFSKSDIPGIFKSKSKVLWKVIKKSKQEIIKKLIKKKKLKTKKEKKRKKKVKN